MSIPTNEFGDWVSTVVKSAAYYSPDSLDVGSMISKERGGIGLSDTTEGLDYQDWTLTWNWQTDEFMIEAPNTPLAMIYSHADVTELSLSFDQNMAPFITFVAAGVAKYWWYDTALGGRDLTTLPAGSVTPRCCLDDKRPYRSGTSDIILCYVHDGKLKMRMERERYLTDNIIADPFVDPVNSLPAYLKKVGMNAINRLQWTCRLAVQ